MEGKPSTTEFDKSPPTIDLVLRVAPLGMRVGIEKPEVRLLKMSDGEYRVAYTAWNSVHETRFHATDYDLAVEFYNRITGQPIKPWKPRRVKPARVGRLPA